MKNYKYYLLALFLCSALCFDIYAQEAVNFDDLFLQWNDTTKLQPGVSMAVLKDDKVIYKKSFGSANLEYQIPMSNQSVYDVASLAKQFTGFAIAKLVIEEQLDLEESVVSFFPELKYLDEGIKIKHLVHHSSGLRDVGELFGLAYVADAFTSKEALEMLKNQKELNFPVGAEYDYSNSNYVLLALIVERITGVTFRKWMDTNLFIPLQMKNSFVNDNPFEVIQDRVIGYNEGDPDFSFNQNNGMSLIGSSAVYTTIDDMVLWARALAEEKEFSEIFKLMKTKGKLNNGKTIDYGFGLGLGQLRGERIIEHTGATPAGFRSGIVFFPEQELTVIVLSNWGAINVIGDLGVKVVDHFLPKKTEIQANPSLAKIQQAVNVSSSLLESYTGDYLFNNEIPVAIRLNEDQVLTVQLEGQPVHELAAMSNEEFDFAALRSKLIFNINEHGVCEQVEVWMNDAKQGELARVKKVAGEVLNLSKYTGLYYSEELRIVFEIGKIDNKLTVLNSKMGQIKLNSKADLIFIPDHGLASSLNFEMNESGAISGFRLNRGSRLRGLNFVRIDGL